MLPDVKWISLALIALLITWFWPDSDLRESVVREDSQSAKNPTHHTPGQKLRTRRTPEKRLSNEELGARITVLWDEISSDPRDPKVVEFIRLLREFGKRDEKEAFDVLDGLEQERDKARWYMARIAVAGGWALRDPAGAAKALMTEGLILPKDFEKQTSAAFSPNGEILFNPAPSQVAVLRQASEIFKAWCQIDPEGAQDFAMALPKDQTSAGLQRMLRKHLPNPAALNPEISTVNRNSIDAILNNPARTTGPSFHFGREIHGDMLDEGEHAFTFEEWAARNPEFAKESLQRSLGNPSRWRASFVTGLARTEPDYLGLLELSPPDEAFKVAHEFLTSVSRPAADEMVWQLDGRESSWTLDLAQRKEAMQRLLDEGNFTPDERAALELKMQGERTALDFVQPPTLPMKKPD